jgi:hypothetical protein
LSFSTQDTKFIRNQTLRAISSNRAPGLHFAGYFSISLCLASRPVGWNSPSIRGRIALGQWHRNRAARSTGDIALAGRSCVLDPNSHRDIDAQVEFTGEPARGLLTASGRGNGFSPVTALPECVAAGRTRGREVMRCRAPGGAARAPRAWFGAHRGKARERNQWPLLKRINSKPAKSRNAVLRKPCARRKGDLFDALCNPRIKRTAQAPLAV